MGQILRDGVAYGGSSSINFAPLYSSFETYAVGEYAVVDGLLRKCITAVTVPETFDPTKWTIVNVAGELDKKTDITATAKTFKIADLYDASTGIYAVGDTCVESGILYICKVPISAAEAFDSSKWDAVTNAAGLFYIQPITTAAHTALLTKDPYTYYAIF